MTELLLLFSNFQIFSTIILIIGIFGIVFNYRNIVITLISIELCLLAINLNFIFNAMFHNDLMGLVFALLVLTVAAAEAAIGLALLVLYFRVRNTIVIEFDYYLKG